jgi:hypothetical protein
MTNSRDQYDKQMSILEEYDYDFHLIEALETRCAALEAMLLECVKDGRLSDRTIQRVMRLLGMGVVK